MALLKSFPRLFHWISTCAERSFPHCCLDPPWLTRTNLKRIQTIAKSWFQYDHLQLHEEGMVQKSSSLLLIAADSEAFGGRQYLLDTSAAPRARTTFANSAERVS